MKYGFIAFLLLISFTGFSQSFFKPIPKLYQPNRFALTATSTAPDSIFLGFRPAVSVVVQAYPGALTLAGAGADYEHDTYNYSTQKWYCDWAVGGLIYAGGTVAPTTPQAAVAAGISVSLFNKLVSIGGAWSFQQKQPLLTFGTSINLNN